MTREGEESTKMRKRHDRNNNNDDVDHDGNGVGNLVVEGKVSPNDELGKVVETSGGSANEFINDNKVADVDAEKTRVHVHEAHHAKDKTTGNAHSEQLSNLKPKSNITEGDSQHGISGSNNNKRTNYNNEKNNTKDKMRAKKKRKYSSQGEGKINSSSASPFPSTTSYKHIFNGLVFAISTLESKNENVENELEPISNKSEEKESTINTKPTKNDTVSASPKLNYQNYKTLTQILTQTLGAHSPISPQIHKRIHCLIATTPAIQNLTQRVRQAYKRNVDIVHVDWVRDCLERGKRLDYRGGNDGGKDEEMDGYLYNDRVGELIRQKEESKRSEEEEKKIKKQQQKNKHEQKRDGLNREGKDHANHEDVTEEIIIIDGDDDDNAGWSTPIQLDCCCVCHENGDDNCPWCLDCNLTLERKN